MNPLFLTLLKGAAPYLVAGVLGAFGAWWIQGVRLDAVQEKFDGFVATTKAIGEAAQKSADKQKDSDKLAKDKADEEHARTIAAYRADIKRLRESNASRSFVPSAGTASLRPDRACFDRAELELALRGFAEPAQGLADEGSKAVIDLNTAKVWAVGRQ